jgi:hypothetical protein
MTRHPHVTQLLAWPQGLLALGLISISSLPAQGGNEQELLTGSGTASQSSEQEKGGRPYLMVDPGGSARPRLYGDTLLPGYSSEDFEIKVGGYFDFEYRDIEGSNRSFRFHRLVPLIESRIGKRIRFQTEIEIEDGQDLAVEFAHLDYDLVQGFNFRGGVILEPLGRLNLQHDSPILELTDRPLVNRKVVPSTFRDAGFGFRGLLPEAFGEGSGASVNYEAYLTGGYRGQSADGSTYYLDRTDGLRNARPHQTKNGDKAYRDNNNSLAFSGRVALKDVGYEVGLSGYAGKWDNAGDLDLFQAVLDLEWSPSAIDTLRDHWASDFRIQFEAAFSDIDRDAAAVAGGVPGKANGSYTQLTYFLHAPESWTTGDDPIVTPGGGFTLVYRFDQVDLDGGKFDRHAFGFNFRPNADRTVFKFEYQLNGEGGSTPRRDDHGFVASFATYF